MSTEMTGMILSLRSKHPRTGEFFVSCSNHSNTFIWSAKCFSYMQKAPRFMYIVWLRNLSDPAYNASLQCSWLWSPACKPCGMKPQMTFARATIPKQYANWHGATDQDPWATRLQSQEERNRQRRNVRGKVVCDQDHHLGLWKGPTLFANKGTWSPSL